MKELLWIGAAFGGGGPDPTCLEAPTILIPRFEAELKGKRGATINEPPASKDRLERWRQFSLDLAKETQACGERLPLIIGGDHSVALGTWNGIRMAQYTTTALPMGLIWIDAHMDSHRPETSPSGNPHGMVLASLLGYGPDKLAQLLRDPPVVSARHLTLIGVRSYEPEEVALLEGLGVRIIMMDEVKQRGVGGSWRQCSRT